MNDHLSQLIVLPKNYANEGEQTKDLIIELMSVESDCEQFRHTQHVEVLHVEDHMMEPKHVDDLLEGINPFKFQTAIFIAPEPNQTLEQTCMKFALANDRCKVFYHSGQDIKSYLPNVAIRRIPSVFQPKDAVNEIHRIFVQDFIQQMQESPAN